MRSIPINEQGRNKRSARVLKSSRVKCNVVTDGRPKTRKEQARGVGVRGDGAKGMNEHALWADLEEVVEVKEAALVGAASIKPELRRHTDLYSSFFFHGEHSFDRNVNINFQMNKIIKTLETHAAINQSPSHREVQCRELVPMLNRNSVKFPKLRIA